MTVILKLTQTLFNQFPSNRRPPNRIASPQRLQVGGFLVKLCQVLLAMETGKRNRIGISLESRECPCFWGMMVFLNFPLCKVGSACGALRWICGGGVELVLGRKTTTSHENRTTGCGLWGGGLIRTQIRTPTEKLNTGSCW